MVYQLFRLFWNIRFNSRLFCSYMMEIFVILPFLFFCNWTFSVETIKQVSNSDQRTLDWFHSTQNDRNQHFFNFFNFNRVVYQNSAAFVYEKIINFSIFPSCAWKHKKKNKKKNQSCSLYFSLVCEIICKYCVIK